MRIFVEAAGSLVSPAMMTMIRESGHVCVASDASEDSVGKHLADEFCQVPFASDEKYTDAIKEIVIREKIDLVIPTLDDALLKWDSIRSYLFANGISLATSNREALMVCQDKWNTYLTFSQNNIPTPETSLKQEYGLVKPRRGRGASGVRITEKCVNMEGMISQEVLVGTEYTVDVFCNINHDPVYIVPRKRMGVKEGKSTAGIVENKPEIDIWVKKICGIIPFTGAINIQCFDTGDGIKFTEINPRFGGGTILGMKATENWIPLTIQTFVEKKVVNPEHRVDYGLKMGRYYAEVFYK